MSTPSTTDVSITGDIAVAVQVQLDETTAERGLFNKRANGVDSSLSNYSLSTFTNGSLGGTLAFTWNTAASTAGGAYGIVPHGIPAGKKMWVGASLDVDNGSGGYTCRFYRSSDGVNWTNYETVTTTSGVTNIRASAAPVNVGGDNAGVVFTAGKYYAAKIWSGLDLTANPVLNWSANDMGQTGGTSNGRVWTASRGGSGRKGVLVEAPVWLFGGDDFMEAPDHADINLLAGDSFTVIAVTRQWNTIQINGQIVTKGTYIAPLPGPTGWLLYNSGTSTATKFLVSDTSFYPNVSSAVAPTAGTINVMAGVRDRAATPNPLLRTYNNGTASTTVTDTTTTTLTNTSPLRIGSQLGSYFGTNTDFELIAVAVFKSALSAAQITTITNHYTTAADSAAVTLLNTAKFWIDASLSQQKALVVRSATGRKAATVVRPTFLFGTNDYMEVADNDLLDFGLSDSYSVVAVTRMWATPSSNGRILSKGSGGVGPAYVMLSNTNYAATWRIDDSAAHAVSVFSPVSSSGALTVTTAVRSPSTITVYAGNTAGTPATDITTTSLASSAPFRIGADYGGGTASTFAEFEMYGIAVFRKALTATEVALVNTHYQGTETPESIALLSTAVFWIDPARSSQEMAINRSTAAGKKAVAVTRPTWLFGTNSYMEVPDNDLLDFGANQDYTVLAIVNTFGTPSTNEVFVGKGVYGNIGVSLAQNATSPNIAYQSGSPFAANYSYLTTTSVTGSRLLAGGRSGSAAFGYADNTPLSYGGGASGGSQNLDVSDAYPLRIGANGGVTANAYANFELLAVAIFRRALTSTEIAAINTYYGTV
jgi:hypothetical protein